MAQITRDGVVFNVDGNGNLVPLLSGSWYTSGRVTITRPGNATPYGINDVVGAAAAAITFPTMGPTAGGEVLITSACIEYHVASVPAGLTTFSLHLYGATPPSALADNATYDLPAGDRVLHLGKFTSSQILDEGATLKICNNAINCQVTVPAGGILFGYLVTTAAFTPAGNSEVLVVTLHAQGL